MRKSFYLLPLFALALASCSGDQPLSNEDNYNGPLQTNFLSVDISTAGSMSRAGESEPESGTGVPGKDYENGIGVENDVKSVRFYFFDIFGNSVKVSNSLGTLNSYLDWDDPNSVPSSSNDPETVEKRLETTLIIRTPEGDRLPSQVVAVLNPSDEVKQTEITNLETLNQVVKNFEITSSSPFVMSNSLYAQNGETMEAVDVTGHIFANSDDAMAQPVKIYVERVNAKVRLNVSLQGKEVTPAAGENGQTPESFTIYSTGVENNTVGATSTDIYVRLLGWNVTSTPNKSYLMKHISPTWDSEVLFGNFWNWNSVLYHRSFWAINPSPLNYTADGDYNFGDFSHAQAVKGFADGLVDANGEPIPNFTYVQENAAESTDAACLHPTHVIIAGVLVDGNGNPLEIAEWATNHFTKEGLLTNLANLANVYKITKASEGGEEKTSWTKLDGKYFKFISGTEANKAAFDVDGRYYSYLQLDEDALTEDGVKLDLTTTPNGAKMEYDAINAELLKIAPAKIWTSGMTYYYFPIQHLGQVEEGDDGELLTYTASYGVVRNHVYACTVTSLKGLGTPVFDSNEVIVPEKPQNDVSMIAAQINILAWRLVKNDNIGLSW